jgi:Copper amine oxidase N-terminal domain
MNTSKAIKTMCALAGISVMAATASAFPLLSGAQIVIDRALNSPTLTVKYSGATAALVELRVNGESLGTRTVSATKANGETNFSLDVSSLKDGDNEVEIRLFDRTGKLVGSEKSNISTEQSAKGPVFLSTPKVGATVMGPVEITLGFGQTLKNSYVSFFVDSNFKSMTNYPPFTFTWDTCRESNGWHEVEAWAIDETSTTYKTRKVRVFVNNPGGRTDRPGVETEITPTKNPSKTDISGAVVGMKAAGTKGIRTANEASLSVPRPELTGMVARSNRINLSTAAGLKPVNSVSFKSAGVQQMMPTGTRQAKVANRATTPKPNVGIIEIQNVASLTKPNQGQVLNSVNAAGSLIQIQKGTRLPNLTSFAVVLNSQFVNFDVQPRVDNGVPMTPFRHLFEKAGGKVEWESLSKSVKAAAEGHNVAIQIGDLNATVNDLSVRLETAPYIDRGRTIVPLSFLRDALAVNVEYDKATGHVLITSIK